MIQSLGLEIKYLEIERPDLELEFKVWQIPRETLHHLSPGVGWVLETDF